MYSPPLGRFLSTDPLQANPTILYDNNWFGDALTRMRNLYGYASNNPLNLVDPSGEYPQVADGVCKPEKPKQYCVYDFKSRTGTSEECLGYDVGDTICCTCPNSGKCDKEWVIKIDSNGVKCTITFVPADPNRKCGECPKDSKNCSDGKPI